MSTVITSPERLRPEWLTSVLRAKNCLPSGEVAAIEVGNTEADNFAIAYRLQLTYTNPINPTPAPHSLVVRLSHPKQG
jgi:hypothetical protein